MKELIRAWITRLLTKYTGKEVFLRQSSTRWLHKIRYFSDKMSGQRAQLIIFTPSGNCYKRYLNSQRNELLIVSGTWEKTDDQTYKVFWSKNNKSKYDILRGTQLYQNASENISSVPVNLYVTRY